MDLFTTLRVLNMSGIGAAAELAADGSVNVWLGDADKGILELARWESMSEAAEWLSAAALSHFPQSDFARVHRFIDAMLVSPTSAGP